MTRWQQNGLLISCVWILVAIAYLRQQEMPRAQAYATQAYYLCAERVAVSGGSRNPCLDNVEKDWNVWMSRQWGRIAAIALLPVAAGWTAAFAGLFVRRRMRAQQN